MTPPVSVPRAYDKKIRLLSGHNVDKNSVVVETIGIIREACATIRLLELTMGWIEAREALVDARTKLVELTRQIGFQRLDLMSIDDIDWIEAAIGALDSKRAIAAETSQATGCLIASACAELAGAQCRRAECRLLALEEVVSGYGAGEIPLKAAHFELGACFLDRVSEILALIAEREEACARLAA